MLVLVNKSHDKTKNNSHSFSFWLNVQICKKKKKMLLVKLMLIIAIVFSKHSSNWSK